MRTNLFFKRTLQFSLMVVALGTTAMSCKKPKDCVKYPKDKRCEKPNNKYPKVYEITYNVKTTTTDAKPKSIIITGANGVDSTVATEHLKFPYEVTVKKNIKKFGEKVKISVTPDKKPANLDIEISINKVSAMKKPFSNQKEDVAAVVEYTFPK